MNKQEKSIRIKGIVGNLEGLFNGAINNNSVSEPLGTAIITHPHPLFEGTMNNKCVQTITRAMTTTGWNVYRFNFRGVGKSEGKYDNGIGEAEDLLQVIGQVSPTGPLVLAGFSFGTYVISRILAKLNTKRDIKAIVYVGTAASRFNVLPVPEELHLKTLVIHGLEDNTVPIKSVLDWAGLQNLPVLVIPKGEHFFHGKQVLLKQLVVRHMLNKTN